MRFLAPLATSILALSWALPAAAAPNVVASIKPLHSLVSAVMQGVGEPHLIVKGGASPHTFSLRPSDAEALSAADLVVWVGPDIENFLEGAIENLAPGAHVIEANELNGMTLLALREDADFEAHEHGDEDHDHDEMDDGHDHDEDHDHEDDHEHDHDDEDHDDEDHHDEEHVHDHDDEDGHEHHHGEFDMHLWLDPANAAVIVEHVAEELVEHDPENAATYEANAQATIERLQALQAEIMAQLAPVTGKPFISFHDAYQYFEHRFGVTAVGAITLNPESQPGARRVTEVREKIDRLGAVCVFAEPQFEPSMVAVVTEGTDVRTGTLDPVGADIADGPDLYFELLQRMAGSMQDCLGS